MNFKEIQSRGHVIHVRSDSKVFKDQRYYSFGRCDSKYSWKHHVERFMKSENYRFLLPYPNEDETNKCFEIMYNSNHHLLEKILKDNGAKLITITNEYTQILGGFKRRLAKMPMSRGILFDSMHHKMLYLVKHPNLFNEN